MTTSSERGPAKIYDFPARGRFAAAARGQSEDSKAAADFAAPEKLLAPSVGRAVFGSSWYHEEAVQEERARGD